VTDRKGGWVGPWAWFRFDMVSETFGAPPLSSVIFTASPTLHKSRERAAGGQLQGLPAGAWTQVLQCQDMVSLQCVRTPQQLLL
jgi:hypothetical protein